MYLVLGQLHDARVLTVFYFQKEMEIISRVYPGTILLLDLKYFLYVDRCECARWDCRVVVERHRINSTSVLPRFV